ncbi:MAG: HD domain-containing protein [Candidatus Nanohaloarchaea archaeon]|nr:HD domain-containing protein [Candidatus Nanohaloarchaea archaeon]
MEEHTVQYRYLQGDGEGELVTERYDIRIDREHHVLVMPGPSEAVSGKPLASYLEEQDYLPSLKEKDLPGREIRRRLPELDGIESFEDQFETLEVLYEECPPSYWTKPASGSGKYHPPDERGVHGQWIHTKRMLRTYRWFAENAQAMAEEEDPFYVLDEEEVEAGLIAAALHDIYKFGRDGTEESATPDHDVKAARYVREETSLPDGVADAIEAHNGPFADGSVPASENELFVHLADYTVAHTASEDLLWEPTEELRFAQVVDRLIRSEPVLEEYTVVFDEQEDL